MKSLILKGNAAGLPVNLTLTTLGTELMLEAASGLILALGVGSGLWLAKKMLDSLLDLLAQSAARNRRGPVGLFTKVSCHPRYFIGACTTPGLVFRSGGQTQQAPLKSISKIKSHSGFLARGVTEGAYSVDMVDGSSYGNALMLQPNLSFLTTAGVQTVDFAYWGQRDVPEPVYKYRLFSRTKIGERLKPVRSHWIPVGAGRWETIGSVQGSKKESPPQCELIGLSVGEAEHLRARLTEVLTQNRQPITEVIGREAFESFFKL